MRWSDFLHPERVAQTVLRICAAGLALVIIGSVLTRALACATLPYRTGLWVLPGLAVLSVVAYLVRERRLNARPRPRNTRGAERTPLLPRTLEEE